MMSDAKIYFYKGKEEVLQKGKDADGEENESELLKKIQEAFSKVFDGKNLSFLLGCGCSSYVMETENGGGDKVWIDVGVPTMLPLANEFYNKILPTADKKWLKEKIKFDIEKVEFKDNLEYFLGALHSIYFFYETTGQEKGMEGKKVSEIIKLARNFLIGKCLNETNRNKGADQELVDLYKSFYRKLLYRNSNLPKPNIFTTNYDLYSEIALDKLGIHYVNGFSGGIKVIVSSKNIWFW